MVILVLAITAPSLDVRSKEADELLEGLEMLGNAEIAPVQGAEQAAQLAALLQALTTAGLNLAAGGKPPSLADVAAAAGVSRATLYRYFPTREPPSRAGPAVNAWRGPGHLQPIGLGDAELILIEGAPETPDRRLRQIAAPSKRG